MRRLPKPVALFLLAAGVPFLLTFTFFVVSQRRSLLTEPAAYMALLDREGRAPHMIALTSWKHFLAQDRRCREAAVIVIGSSRVREIDDTVTGAPTCNLYVDGLAAQDFAQLARDLPQVPARPRHVAYVGIDHFWLWVDRGRFHTAEFRLLELSPTAWRAWSALRPLEFFTVSDFGEAVRRYRHPDERMEEENNVWYPDGHLVHPRYYAQKRLGARRRFDRRVVEDTVARDFGYGRLHESSRRALEHGLATLTAKGYAVRVFWNPVAPEYIAAARRHYPSLFQETVRAVDRIAATLPLDVYVPAARTLDPTPFGCTERDYFDLTHMDVDCLRRVFAAVFGSTPSPAEPMRVQRGGDPRRERRAVHDGIATTAENAKRRRDTVTVSTP
jgi:hypothetical protein